MATYKQRKQQAKRAKMEKLRLVLNPCTIVPEVLSVDKHAELQAKLNQLGANQVVS